VSTIILGKAHRGGKAMGARGNGGKSVNKRLAVLSASVVTVLVVSMAGLMLLQPRSSKPNSELPVVSFTYTYEDPETSLTVTFNASESYDPDGSIANYSWSFGDGTTGDGMVIRHEFITAGYHETVLTVTDDKGDKNQTSKEIVVNMRAHCEYEIVSANGFTVVLSAAKSYDPDGGSLDYEWTFLFEGASVWDDWNSTVVGSSHEVEVTFVFDNPGVYGVYLEVTDDEGFGASTSFGLTIPAGG
jgi:PKD repeat protein